jgi:hypothetical protein
VIRAGAFMDLEAYGLRNAACLVDVGGFAGLQTFFEEGRGKKTEGNAWILYAYLKKRRNFGLLPLSNEALDDAVQVLVNEGLLIQQEETKHSPYSVPDDFEQRKNIFLEGIER